jgi:hypothetical protein
MSPIDHLRWLLIPDRSRWKPMLMGLALSAAGVGAAAALQPPALLEGVLIVLAFAAWFVGACGMIGYVRWFFASERVLALRDKADADEREKK